MLDRMDGFRRGWLDRGEYENAFGEASAYENCAVVSASPPWSPTELNDNGLRLRSSQFSALGHSSEGHQQGAALSRSLMFRGWQSSTLQPSSPRHAALVTRPGLSQVRGADFSSSQAGLLGWVAKDRASSFSASPARSPSPSLPAASTLKKVTLSLGRGSEWPE